MSAFLKSFVFIRPHNMKTAFAKRSTRESVFEKLVDTNPDRIKKMRFKNVRIRVDGATRVATGGTRVATGGTRVATGGTRVATGGTRVATGGS